MYETTYAIIGLIAFSTVVVLMLTGAKQEITVVIKSKGGDRTYLAKRIMGTKGKDVYDWTYYDEDGDTIEDETVLVSLFESFSEEDWYGDYEYYVDDSSYHVDETLVEDIKEEEKIIESIPENKPTISEEPKVNA